MLTSTLQSTVPLLVAKILTHLVSEVFAESDVRAEGKQNKCVSVTRRGTLPVCLAKAQGCGVQRKKKRVNMVMMNLHVSEHCCSLGLAEPAEILEKERKVYL